MLKGQGKGCESGVFLHQARYEATQDRSGTDEGAERAHDGGCCEYEPSAMIQISKTFVY